MIGGTEMITNFGKELRKLRIDNDELLKDMADKLGVTISYLSAVEHGKREVPDDWVDTISKLYQLSDAEKDNLEDLAYMSKNKVSIDLLEVNDKKKNTALAFARKFDNLSDEEINKINKILNNKEDD